jgi:hypothetical protein
VQHLVYSAYCGAHMILSLNTARVNIVITFAKTTCLVRSLDTNACKAAQVKHSLGCVRTSCDQRAHSNNHDQQYDQHISCQASYSIVASHVQA